MRKIVQDVLPKLKKGCLIEVLWIDACVTQNVRSFNNKTFATYKKSVGRFVGIFKDHRYREPHLIISNEITDEDAHDITSVPLGIAMRIKMIDEKTAQKTIKSLRSKRIKLGRVQKFEPLKDGGLKIVCIRV
ncbi:MAG: hypothetical protein H3Z50_00215 [archaeon]|nr:hypothetical protein [archaeon]MCP8305882.1 hypothetical protein [archaeon]